MSKSVKVWIGNGDRIGPTVTCSLLSDDESIRIRALQELAKFNNVVHSRVASLPIQNGLEVGDARQFYYNILGITGRHLITAFSFNIGAEEGSSMELTMEQFGRMGNYQIEITGEGV